MKSDERNQEYVWVLAINATKARIIRGLHSERDARAPNLEITTEHRRIGAIMSDQPGRSYPPGRGGRRASMEAGSDVLESVLQPFLREVVDALELGRVRGEFRGLVVFSDPKVLGHLRENWTSAIEKLVLAEVPKNIVDLRSEQIEARAKRVLAAPGR